MLKCVDCLLHFNSRTSLWRHRRDCSANISCEDDTKIQLLNNIFQTHMKDNKELRELLIDQNNKLLEFCKSKTDKPEKTYIGNNNNINSNNKTFNLQLFLNETCKNALNINEFVSSIKVSLSELENTGRQGYIEGISSIILKHLNKLEQYQRPIHCCDVKREVIYIKDNDKWEKECDEKPILTKAIKVIANENIKKITEWRENNPDCTNSDSKKNNMYLKIVSNSMNGSDKEEGQKNITKIISNLAKETTIQKEI